MAKVLQDIFVLAPFLQAVSFEHKMAGLETWTLPLSYTKFNQTPF